MRYIDCSIKAILHCLRSIELSPVHHHILVSSRVHVISLIISRAHLLFLRVVVPGSSCLRIMAARGWWSTLCMRWVRIGRNRGLVCLLALFSNRHILSSTRSNLTSDRWPSGRTIREMILNCIWRQPLLPEIRRKKINGFLNDRVLDDMRVAGSIVLVDNLLGTELILINSIRC